MTMKATILYLSCGKRAVIKECMQMTIKDVLLDILI